MSTLYTNAERASLDAFFAAASRALRGMPHVHAVSVEALADPKFLARSNEVAMIAVNNVQAQLPRLHLTHAGAVTHARAIQPRRETPVPLVSQALFEIHWRATGAAFASPEAYRLTFLPGYDRFVVTASQESTDAHGVCDEAIGWFDAGFEPMHAVRLIVCRWWSSLAEACDQKHWQGVSKTGLVTAEEAWAWAETIWQVQPEAVD